MTRSPDVVLTPTSPAGPPVGVFLAGDGKTSDYSSGGNAWNSVDRPRRSPYIEFGGRLLKQLDMPVILDGADTLTSIEPALAAIRSWRDPSTQTGIGTVLRVSGPVDTTGVTGWVLQSLAVNDAIRRASDGARVQQNLDITLIEYTDGSTTTAVVSPASTAAATLPFPFNLLTPQLQALASSYTGNLAALAQEFSPNLHGLQTYVASHGDDLSRIANAVPQLQTQVRAELANLAAVLPRVISGMPQRITGRRNVVVRPGDNLESIATRELGDYRLWTAIALLNDIRDPNRVRAGQVLRLP